MALTVSQYNSIMRQYEERQTRNRHLREKRLHHIYETVAGYQALDESVASISVTHGKKMLERLAVCQPVFIFFRLIPRAPASHGQILRRTDLRLLPDNHNALVFLLDIILPYTF